MNDITIEEKCGIEFIIKLIHQCPLVTGEVKIKAILFLRKVMFEISVRRAVDYLGLNYRMARYYFRIDTIFCWAKASRFISGKIHWNQLDDKLLTYYGDSYKKIKIPSAQSREL